MDFGLFRHRNIEQLEAGRLLPGLLGLVSDRHDIAGEFERIRPHEALRQFGLHHHLRPARVRHIDRGKIFRRAFVRQPDDAPPVLGDLDRHPLAHAAEATEFIMGEELEVPAHAIRRAAGQGVGGGGHAGLHGTDLTMLRRRLALPIDLPYRGDRDKSKPGWRCHARPRTAHVLPLGSSGSECYAAAGCYRSEIAKPLKSAFSINPTCRPVSSKTAPFSLVITIPRTPRPTATPAPPAP